MAVQLQIAGLALAALAAVAIPASSAGSPWNMLTPVTAAPAQDLSESGTDGGMREDEPELKRDGEPGSEGGDGQPVPPEEDFGCPIRDQDSFEMII